MQDFMSAGCYVRKIVIWRTRAAAVRIGAETYDPLPPFLVAVALYAPIVFVLVSLQRWIERRQIMAEVAA